MTSIHRRGRPSSRDEGFTLVEMLVAITIIAGVLVSLAFLMTGAMAALSAARQRSAATEVVNAEMEKVRAAVWLSVGVKTTDPDYAAQYPSGKFNGRDAVPANGTGVPAAKTVVTTSPDPGMPVPYTVERWVTWTDTASGTGQQLKRIDVRVSYTENRKNARHQDLTSVLYPGGTATGIAVNTPPVADFSGPPSTIQNSSVSFTATATDAESDPLTYLWDFGDGTGTSNIGPTTTHVFASTGNFTVVLRVADDRGGSVVASHPITVSAPPPNLAPNAVFNGPTTSGGRTDVISVNATGSTDPENDPLTYSWSWGDASSNSAGISASHAYLATGTFTITLSVSDPGHTVLVTRTQTVTAVGCTITSGSFRQSTQTVDNQIHISNGNKASPSAFTFTATSTLACVSMSAKLPLSGNPSLTSFATAAPTSTVGSVKNWSWTGDTGNNQFNSSSPQNAEFWTPSADGSSYKFTIQFILV